jgi:phage repressor protein C with HTH and peptisase S24 domain
MKKWLKYIGILVGAYLALTIVYALVSVFFESDKSDKKTYNIETPLGHIKSVRNEGPSMEPTIASGSDLQIDTAKKPATGEIIAFDCFSKCDKDGNFDSFIKRLIEINDQGCYWVEGDNHEHSNDSNDFGWLCPNDIKIDGVVVK